MAVLCEVLWILSITPVAIFTLRLLPVHLTQTKEISLTQTVSTSICKQTAISWDRN